MAWISVVYYKTAFISKSLKYQNMYKKISQNMYVSQKGSYNAVSKRENSR